VAPGAGRCWATPGSEITPETDPRRPAHRRTAATPQVMATMSEVLAVGIIIAVAGATIVLIGAVFLVAVVDEDTDLDN
jgi:hypothetical protein